MKPTINSNTEPEKLEEIVVEKDELVEETIQTYHHIEWLFKLSWEERKLKTPILSPAQIDVVLQRILHEAPERKILHSTTGLYLSHLIDQSHNAGHNNFTITTGEKTLYYLAYSLQGTKEQPLQLTINGNGGYRCANNSIRCNFIINGNTDNLYGCRQRHCNNTIQGNTGNDYGFGQKHCTNDIQGNIGELYGYSQQDCKNRTTNPETYKKMKYKRRKNCYLLDYQGNILEHT